MTALPSNTAVYRSGDDLNHGCTTATGGFLTFAGGLTQLAGQTVQLKFYFDSMDSIGNTQEGAYVDTVQVMSNCTP